MAEVQSKTELDMLAEEANKVMQNQGMLQRGTTANTGTEVEGKKTRKPADTRSTLDVLDAAFKGLGRSADGAVVDPASPKYQLMAVMSDKAQICGFIVPKGHKITISCATNKSGQRSFKVADKMSTKIAGVIMRYPNMLAEAIRKCDSTTGADPEYDYPLGTPQTFRDAVGEENIVTIMLWDQALNWINNNTTGTISEAPAIFRPYTKTQGGQTKTYQFGDSTRKYTLHNNIKDTVVKIEQAKQAGDTTALESLKNKVIAMQTKFSRALSLKSYRGKILTDGNYIALAEYVPAAYTTKYTAEEAALYNEKYIKPLFNSKKDKNAPATFDASKLSSLVDAERSWVNVDEAGVHSSVFFSTDQDSKIVELAGKKAITAWYDSTVAIAPENVRLPKLVVKTGVRKSGPRANTEYRTVQEVIAGVGQNIDGTVLIPWNLPETHTKIYNATDKLLTSQMVEEFRQKLKDSTSKGGSRGSSLNLAGMDLNSISKAILTYFPQQA